MKRKDLIILFSLLFSSCHPNRSIEIENKVDSLDKKASSYFYPKREIQVDSSISYDPYQKIINVYCTDSLYKVLYISNETIDSLAKRIHTIAFFEKDSIFKIEYEKEDLKRNTRIGASTLYFLTDTTIKHGTSLDINEAEIARVKLQNLFDNYIFNRPRRYFEK